MTDSSQLDLSSQQPWVRLAIGAVAVTAAAAVAVAHRAQPLVALALSLVVVAYGVLAAVDVAEQRLPNRGTVPLAGSVVAAVLADGALRAGLGAALGAIGAGLALALLLLVMQFGLGDVKLALSVGTIAAWLGQDALVVTTGTLSLAGALVAVALMARHRRRRLSFSYGPVLAVGSVAGMLAAAH